MLGLAWPHVDLDRGTVAVRQALTRSRYAHGCGRPSVCGARSAARSGAGTDLSYRTSSPAPGRAAGGCSWRATAVHNRQVSAMIKSEAVRREVQKSAQLAASLAASPSPCCGAFGASRAV